ncbi:MAG TPA: O-antigen ligase family protein [Pyrinomonadaceae bacterium]|nr:O-antigen ligase family protein [Pyrinomonadaceae bacterium]
MDTSFSLTATIARATAGSAIETSRVLVVLDRVVFYGLIALIALTAIPYGTVHAWSLSAFECAVFLLTLLWIVHGLLAGSWRVGNTRLLFPIFALMVLAALQSVVWWKIDLAGSKVGYSLSADPFESWVFVFRVSALILVALLLIRFTTSRKRLTVLIHTIIGVAVISALFGIARQAMQHSPGFVLSKLRPAMGYGQFINKNHFPFLMEMAMGLVVGVAFMRGKRRERIPLYLSALLAMWAALVLSVSRGGLMAMAAQIIFAALLFVNSRRVRKAGSVESQSDRFAWTRSIAVKGIMATALLGIIVFGIIWLAGDQLATGVESAAAEMTTLDRTELHEGSRRRDIWQASWQMFKAHPIVGAGLGGYWAEFPTYHQASGVTTPQQAHNDYLELLSSGGLLGAALLVWFAVVLVKQARRSVRTNEGFQRAATLGAIVGLAGVGVHSIVDFGLHITVNALVFMALLAIISIAPIPKASRLRVKRSQV